MLQQTAQREEKMVFWLTPAAEAGQYRRLRPSHLRLCEFELAQPTELAKPTQ
tara:strand:+ start:108 stop:263 length:156 start_codon:yes stop_codon:yes gene_type:complete